MIEVVLLFLALSFGLHVAMANLGIGLSTIIPILKKRGEEENKEIFVNASKELMRFYVSIYALAGVFGTAFTVFLLSFYPGFIGLAGHITFTPFAIAILAIVLHFFAITAYWYGWDKWDRRTHYYVGLLLLVSVYLIPLGFRAVSAFLNTPYGLELEPKPHLNVAEALTNPTFAPLYLKSIFAALSATFFAIASGYAYRYMKRGDENSLEIVRTFMPYATATLMIALLFGAIYAATLYAYVPYKFSNAFGRDVWMFGVKVIAIAIQLYAVYVFRAYVKRGVNEKMGVIVYSGPAALIGVFAGEMLNSFSQYPYFVAKLGEAEFVSAIPEPARSSLAEVLTMTNLNQLTQLPSLYVITLMFLVPLLVAAAFFLYLILFAEERRELPE